jgi:hypothetical protein
MDRTSQRLPLQVTGTGLEGTPNLLCGPEELRRKPFSNNISISSSPPPPPHSLATKREISRRLRFCDVPSVKNDPRGYLPLRRRHHHFRALPAESRASCASINPSSRRQKES